MKALALVILCLVPLPIHANNLPAPLQKVRDYRAQHEVAILQEFFSLLALPNIAEDVPAIEKNAAAIQEMMKRRGLESELLRGTPGTPPSVYGEYRVPNATRTILLYAHFDGQPVDPAQWTITPPWEPVLIESSGKQKYKQSQLQSLNKIDPEWRIYARSASDNKAGVLTTLTAFQALRENKIPITSNLKFFYEGEEEAGSPNLDAMLKKYGDKLKADAWIICDGPVHQSGRKQVVFGVRGDTNVDVTVYGAVRPLHSGHYGNWAPNPAMRLAQLLASMKDANGNVTIEGWNDDVEPLSDVEQKAIANAPQYDEELKKKLGIPKPDGAGKKYLELLHLPSLNINGFASGDVGNKARNVIPTIATAVLDLRVVKGNDYQRQVDKLIRHIRKQGYHVLDREPTPEERGKHPLIATVIHRSGGYNAQRTRMDLPISKQIADAVQSSSAEPIVTLPSLGGSLPLSIITENIDVAAVTVPIANYDNNQHAENENIRLQNLWDGMETAAALMTMP